MIGFWDGQCAESQNMRRSGRSANGLQLYRQIFSQVVQFLLLTATKSGVGQSPFATPVGRQLSPLANSPSLDEANFPVTASLSCMGWLIGYGTRLPDHFCHNNTPLQALPFLRWRSVA
jgi:hypothetical protein